MKTRLLITLYSILNKKAVFIFSIITVFFMTINISQIKAQCKLTVNAGLDKTVNAGNSEELYAQASGGSTYTFLWSDGATTQSNIVIPTTTTTYTVTVTSGSCSATDAVVLTYNFCLSVNAGSDQTISSGKSTTLTAQATGGSNQTYSWSNGKTSLGTTASITASPTTRTTYYVTAKYSTCLATDNLVVFVDPTTPTNPTSGTATIKFTTSSLGGNYDPEHVLAVWITDSKGNFVKTLELNAATRKQYLTGWAASSAYNTVDAVTGPTLLDHTSHVVTWNGLDFDGNPVADGNYIVNIEFTDDIATGISQTIPFTKGTQSQHLTPADQSNFTSMDLQWTPSSGCNLTVSAGQDKTISKGSTVTLTATASGGSNYSYSWNPGNFTTSSISVTPSTPNTYIVTVTSGSCTATAKVGVCVLMVDAGSSQTINSGQTATLSPYISCSGSGYTFTWNNGMAGQSITVSPTTTTTYILTVSGNGATATGSVVITVNGQACNLSVNAGSNQTICIGKSATLTSTVTGAGSVTTYTWSNNSNQQNTVVTPTGTTTYFITVNSGTCSASNSVVITTHILPTPNAGPDVTITSGQSTTLNCTSGVSFVWSTNQSGSSIVVSPTVTTSYTVTATDVAGCTATDGVKVTVNQPACNLTVNAGGDWTVCLGTNIQITANPTGGTYYSYLWSTLDTTKSIKVAPTTNTTYTVTVISGNCTASTTVKVTVNSVPNANAGANQTIISGNSATLTATGGGTYTWSNAANTASITVSPTTTTTYYVTVTLNTCQKVSSVIVFVNQPSCNLAVNAGTNQTICSGKTANLTATASGGTNYTYKWSNNLTTASISVTPATTTTYTLTTTSGNCTATASVSVTVNQTPIANAGADQTICNGSCTSLTAIGGGTYTWSNGTTTATISVCPTTNTIFIVTVTSNNCTATDNISVTVNQNPLANAGADQTVCAGACTSLSATGGGTYLWSNGTTSASISICPTLSTTYSVTVTSNNCSAADTIRLEVSQLPLANAGANQ
ncbi:MAG: DUF2271 domain-containing protein, partial [Bacteroidota bacterium]|nr:DUF2271 domain-containing protein [Bacteroidota bacterium]